MTENTLQALSDAMANAVEKIDQSLVTVDARRRLPATGIATQGNLILTADHVVSRDEDIQIYYQGEQYAAEVAGRDPESDIAVLRIEDMVFEPATPVLNDPKVGQIALAVGRPSTQGVQASLGVVSAYGGIVRMMHPRAQRGRSGRRGRGRSHGRGHGHQHHDEKHEDHAEHKPVPSLEKLIRTDAIPYPGFSGGPLVDVQGSVIGLNTSGLVRGMSLAIPAARAWQIAEMLGKHGSVQRGYLGVRSQVTALPESQQTALERDQETGLLLIWIEENSPAQAGGLIVGDILVGMASSPVLDPEDLQHILTGDVVGKDLEAEVLRGGQPVKLSIKIGSRS